MPLLVWFVFRTLSWPGVRLPVNWVKTEWYSHHLSQCGVRLHVNWANAEDTNIYEDFIIQHWLSWLESHSLLTRLTWSLTWRWLSWRGMRLRVNWVTAKIRKAWRIQEQTWKHSKAFLFGLYMFDQCKKPEQKNLMQVYL
jgi:hypothetical protein